MVLIVQTSWPAFLDFPIRTLRPGRTARTLSLEPQQSTLILPSLSCSPRVSSATFQEVVCQGLDYSMLTSQHSRISRSRNELSCNFERRYLTSLTILTSDKYRIRYCSQHLSPAMQVLSQRVLVS